MRIDSTHRSFGAHRDHRGLGERSVGASTSVNN
jgi:hypothetical protein